VEERERATWKDGRGRDGRADCVPGSWQGVAKKQKNRKTKQMLIKAPSLSRLIRHLLTPFLFSRLRTLDKKIKF